MTPTDLDDVLDLSEAADLFGRNLDALRKAAQRGRLRARKVGPGRRSVWIVTRAEMERYMTWHADRHRRQDRAYRD